MNMTSSLLVNKSMDQVWSAITNIKNAQNMISGILELKVLKESESGLVGLKWQETRKVFGKVETETMWITEVEKSEAAAFYKTRAESHGCIYISTMKVQQQGDETLLSMEFYGEGVSFFAKLMDKLMGFMMKGSMEKLMSQDLEDIKAFVEKS